MLFYCLPPTIKYRNVEGKVYILVNPIKNHGLHLQKDYWK